MNLAAEAYNNESLQATKVLSCRGKTNAIIFWVDLLYAGGHCVSGHPSEALRSGAMQGIIFVHGDAHPSLVVQSRVHSHGDLVVTCSKQVQCE